MIWAQAADSASQKDKKWFGLNTSFVNRFLPLENNIGESDGYIFHYVKEKDSKNLKRHAFAIDFSASFDDPENGTRRNDFNIELDYKNSTVKRTALFKGGYLWYGPEMVLTTSYRRSRALIEVDMLDPTTNTSSTTRASIGLGPFLGFEYCITGRISIVTEAFYRVFITGNLESAKIEDDPEADFKDKRLNVFDSWSHPRSITIFFKF